MNLFKHAYQLITIAYIFNEALMFAGFVRNTSFKAGLPVLRSVRESWEQAVTEKEITQIYNITTILKDFKLFSKMFSTVLR